MSVPGKLSFNGGGETHGTSDSYGKGGGATDIRLSLGGEEDNDIGDWNNDIGLNSRIMVAAGGGSGQGAKAGVGGHGGTLTGISGTNINPEAQMPTQNSGFAFGYGRGGYGGESWGGAGRRILWRRIIYR